MKLRWMTLTVVTMLLIGCGGAKILTEAQKQELKAWGTEKPFIIESDWAKPMPTAAYTQVAMSGILGLQNTSGSINLIGNSNFFKMKGDTIAAYLPFYGERYIGGGYGRSAAIEFNGVPKKREIVFNEDKRRTEMRFQIYQKDDNEVHNILVMIFANNKTRIDVNSSERAFITYEGEIKALK